MRDLRDLVACDAMVIECANRLRKHQESGDPLRTMVEVAEDLDVTAEELEAVGDVEIEDE